MVRRFFNRSNVFRRKTQLQTKNTLHSQNQPAILLLSRKIYIIGNVTENLRGKNASQQMSRARSNCQCLH